MQGPCQWGLRFPVSVSTKETITKILIVVTNRRDRGGAGSEKQMGTAGKVKQGQQKAGSGCELERNTFDEKVQWKVAARARKEEPLGRWQEI